MGLADQLKAAIRVTDPILQNLGQASGVGKDNFSRCMRGERGLPLVPAENLARALGYALVKRQQAGQSPRGTLGCRLSAWCGRQRCASQSQPGRDRAGHSRKGVHPLRQAPRASLPVLRLPLDSPGPARQDRVGRTPEGPEAFSSGGGMAKPRDPRQVIDAALAENRYAETLCYFLSALFAVGGLIALLVGAFRGEGVVALAGAVGAGLFWPALKYAKGIREQNVFLRTLEIPLALATTAEEAMKLIQQAFPSSGKAAP